jgi:hypothetical protein
MANSIDLTQLKSDFGTWLGTNENEILKALTQPTASMAHMTTVKQNEDFRAAQATIASLVQGFQKGWTPKGTPAFTPLIITHKRHKFDVEIYPDEIYGSWLGFMADESKNRTEWPLVKYILYKMLLDQVAQDRELSLIAKGAYTAPTDGTAQATGLSMDGFLTILKAAHVSGTSKINFNNAMVAITSSNVLTQVEKFADGITGVYKSVPMNVFCSPENFTYYCRKRRELFGANLDYTGFVNAKIDGTSLTLQPLPSMIGSDVLFATPKANFIRLLKLNDGASVPFVETSKRQVFLFADWYENIGFAMAEAVFAYVPDAGSASV